MILRTREKSLTSSSISGRRDLAARSHLVYGHLRQHAGSVLQHGRVHGLHGGKQPLRP